MLRREKEHYYQYLLARRFLNAGKADSTILFCDKVLKSVDNNFFFVYIRPRARLLKAQALAQLNQAQQVVAECEWVLNQFRRADEDLPILIIA